MKATKLIGLFALIGILTVTACKNTNKDEQSNNTPTIPEISYSIVHSYPHDTTLFTEGLEFYKENLYESSGSPDNIPFTRSVIGNYTLPYHSTFDAKIELNKDLYFGEGITFLNDKLYQLTYKNQSGFVYDANTFKKIKEFIYSSDEGWGLTNNGQNIIMSDGTEKLTFLNPDNLQTVKQLTVTENGMKRDSLNELEYINGYIYANIWLSSYIVKIDTSSGKIVGKIDFSDVVRNARFLKLNAQELNGIAYNPHTKKVFITGKLWPEMYEIDFEK